MELGIRGRIAQQLEGFTVVVLGILELVGRDGRE